MSDTWRGNERRGKLNRTRMGSGGEGRERRSTTVNRKHTERKVKIIVIVVSMRRAHARSKGDLDPILYESQGFEIVGTCNINE